MLYVCVYSMCVLCVPVCCVYMCCVYCVVYGGVYVCVVCVWYVCVVCVYVCYVCVDFSSVTECLLSKHKALDLVPSMGREGGDREGPSGRHC